MSWKHSDPGNAPARHAALPERQRTPLGFEGMDGVQLRAHMEDADRRAAEAESLANRQRALVGALARGGLDDTEARRLLGILEQRLALAEAERDRMRRDLVALKRREEGRAAEPAPNAL